MKSIGIKITVIMLCVILLGIAITVGVTAFIAGNTITDSSVDRLLSETGRQALSMDEWINYHKAVVSATATAISQLSDMSSEQLTRILSAELVNNSLYQDVYIGFPDNTAIMGSGYPIENDYDTWKATERGWYQLAMSNTNQTAVTSLYIDHVTGNLCITVVQAVKRGSTVIGVVGIDILVNILQDIVLSSTLDATGYSMLLDSNGDIFIHPSSDYAPDAEGNFKNLATVMNGTYADLWNLIRGSDGSYKYEDAQGVLNYYTTSTLETTGWRMVTKLPTNVVTQPMKSVILIIIPIAFVILVLAAFLIFMTIRNMITRPLVPMTEFFDKASNEGDLALEEKDVKMIERYSVNNDEIGRLYRSVVKFVMRITDVSVALGTVADGDLNVELPALSDKDTLGNSVNKMADNLNHMFGEINSFSAQVADGAKQVADGAQSLAQGSTEQASSMDELTSKIADIAHKTRENANTAEKAADLAETIMGNAEKGSRQMDEMIAAVGEINDASKSISKIIKAIDDIAFQTNILALNAAVEAARAGQHGKGFAVVAEEVRNLASKSAEAAKDTGVMIQNSMDKAGLGVRIADETAASLTEIVSDINESSKLINEIARSSEEQSDGIDQINTDIDQVAQVIQQNSATAEESAAASEEMSGQSDILQQLVSHFKLKGN